MAQYSLSRLEKNDLGVILNYIQDVLDENNFKYPHSILAKIEDTILDYDSWKVEDSSGKIVAFGSVEHSTSSVATLANLYVAPEYRQTKAVYLIYTKLLDILEPYKKVVSFSLGGSHDITSKFCKNNIIDTEQCRLSMERFKNRWEVVQKQ